MAEGTPESVHYDLEQNDKYEGLLNELNELNTLNDGNDNVELTNKKLNSEFKNFLVINPSNFQSLRAKINEISSDPEKVKAAGKGFQKLCKFIDDLSNDMEEDYNEFKEKLEKNPKSLSRMNEKEINRAIAYLRLHNADALKIYQIMKGAKLEGTDNKDKNNFNKVRDALKKAYGKTEAFLKEDFPGLNSSLDCLKKFGGDDWTGEDFGDDATLNGQYDENQTIVDKTVLIGELNRLNGERIEGIKTDTINGCYDKIKANRELRKLKEGENITLQCKVEGERKNIAFYDTVTHFGNELQELIGGQALNESEKDRLRKKWSNDSEFQNAVYDKLFNNENVPEETPPAPEQEPETTNIEKFTMKETDFNNMETALGKDAMFIIKKETGEGDNKVTTYSYNYGKLKEYLTSLKDLNYSALNALKDGSRIARISAVQIALNKINNAGLDVDGKLGNNTDAAIRNFQRLCGIAVDGKPGKDTIQKLLDNNSNDSLLNQVTDTDLAGIKSVVGEDKMFISVENGEVSYDVDKAKEYLNTLRTKDWSELKSKLGTPEGRAWIAAIQVVMNSLAGGKIRVDGKLGSETKNRIRAFQNDYNKSIPEGSTPIKADGLPGKDTITVLLEGKIGDTVLNGERKIDQNGQIAFLNGTEIKEEGGKKYIEIGGQKYYEYRNGMNGLGYYSGINDQHKGFLYVGNFKNGNYEGQGTYTWANGVKYEGEWKNNNMEGQGTYTWANGVKYEGEFKGNKMEGQGTITWANGDKYEGQWKNDKREGQGTYTWANGVKYEGEFKGNKMISGKFTLGGKEYQVVRDNNLMRIVGSDNDGKFIDQNASDGPVIVDGPASS